MEKAHLNDHFNYLKIFKMTIFPIVMMVFTSLYSIIDGIFVSNFTEGGDAFAAINLVFPFIMIIGSIGFMMGAGGTALVSKLLGERNKEKANKVFSLIIYSTIVIGLVISISGYFAIEPIVRAMGSITDTATEAMIEDGIIYGKILILAQVAFMLQNVFQSFFMVAEKSKYGFIFTFAAGLTNMLLDGVFIGWLRLGVIGAAVATIAGYLVGGIGPLLYFFIQKKGIISLGKTEFDIKAILRSAYNGMSEFVSNISMSVVSIVYNAQLLKMYGQNGVSAYGIVMYVSFVFIAIFIGYSLGMAPVIGYNYGAQNHEELKNVLKKSILVIAVTSIFMFAFALFTAGPFSRIFSDGDESLVEISTLAMRVNSVAFLACGFSIFASSFFTALNNGTISAIISILRTLFFQILFAYILPLIFGKEGIWWGMTGGEIMALFMSIIFLLANRKKYGY